MKWKKSPPELIELFDEVLPRDPRAERRKMFGYPCSFVNGNLWLGLHQHNLLLRLGEADRADFLKLPEACVFEPLPGRTMKEYVCAPQALLEEPKELSRWVARAFRNALALAPKVDKGPKRKAEQAAPKKPAAKKAAPKKAAPKKAASKKVSPKKATPKKATPKKAAPKKAAPKQGKPAQRRAARA